MLLALLGGCFLFDKIEDVGDAIEGLTNPLVAQGIVLGVEEPQQEELQPLVDAGLLVPGTGVTVFLADAADADEMDEAPVAGALVVVDTSDGPVDASEREAGLYSVDPGPESPGYVDGAVWTALADVGDGKPHAIGFPLPPAAVLVLPALHTTNTGLELDLTGQGFHSALVIVTEVTSAQTTYSSEPVSIEDLYSLSSNEQELGVYPLPPEAFPIPGTYALGVAGMQNGTDDDLEGVNTLLSRGMAGKMRFFPIVVPY